ncbi:MarR family winged helix-turn-helix transcriptional regulator [Actinacidiphila glaucinigra]|uniref:MarR family winged helix-turn-helix transcriptional regulator n=1 Tax=Actinacidiphila glaucinigra TaxID=235986 RepID=UPI0035DE753E
METRNGTLWLTADEQSSWRIHLEVGKLLTHRLDRELRPFGLRYSDYEILAHLSESPGHRMRMSDLVRATLHYKSRVSQQVTRMETAGLVYREICESDRRAQYVVLTEQGRETIRMVAPHHVAAVREHFIDLLPADLPATLCKALTPVAEHLRAVRGKA